MSPGATLVVKTPTSIDASKCRCLQTGMNRRRDGQDHVEMIHCALLEPGLRRDNSCVSASTGVTKWEITGFSREE